MRIVNTTQVPAKLVLSRGARRDDRIGVIAAKATFTLAGATPQLDVAHAFDVLDQDEPTELGLLPADLLPRRRPYFEVIVLGRAHAGPGGSCVASTVELAVDDRVRRIRVVGERRWQPQAGGFVAPAPAAFSSMPLTWDRAFGGRARVQIDDGAELEIADPLNPEGRGWNPHPQAHALARHLRAPAGFPVVDEPGWLACLDEPGVDVVDRAQVVPPLCWATVPRNLGVAMAPASTPVWHDDDPLVAAMDRVALRAHPDWILPPPPAPVRVRIVGMQADGSALEFRVPALRVFADGAFGGHTTSLALRPETLVVLPEQRRFYVVHRANFHAAAQHASGHALRLRVETGWATAPQER